MNPSLIPAILTYVREKSGYTTKTKLLKLLYLLDVATFQEKQITLTGFNWIFYKYGPWTGEYDSVLEQNERDNVIRLTMGNRVDLDTVFIDAVEPVKLSEVFPKAVDELKARRIIEAWADRPTGELLDYVYFHTAPMRDARRGEALDFSAILKEEPRPDYKRTRTSLDLAEQKRKRQAFRAAISASRDSSESPFIRPRYDTEFWDAVEALDREPD